MGTTPTPGYGPILTDVTKWREQIKFPDLSTIDWKAAWERDGADLEEYEGKLRMMITDIITIRLSLLISLGNC